MIKDETSGFEPPCHSIYQQRHFCHCCRKYLQCKKACHISVVKVLNDIKHLYSLVIVAGKAAVMTEGKGDLSFQEQLQSCSSEDARVKKKQGCQGSRGTTLPDDNAKQRFRSKLATRSCRERERTLHTAWVSSAEIWGARFPDHFSFLPPS